MQRSVRTSVQIRNLRDIRVTTTPDLVFELVIILNIFPYHSIIVHSSPSCVHLIPCFGFMRPLFQPLSPLYSIYPLAKLRGRNFCKVGGL